MDSLCSVLALQELLNFFSAQRNGSQSEFDVVVYDCSNSEEILGLIDATERARYVRDLAEKTDIGRLASPSLTRLIYDSARSNGKTSEGRLSSELRNETEQLLQRISVWFADPSKFACFLIMDPRRSVSLSLYQLHCDTGVAPLKLVQIFVEHSVIQSSLLKCTKELLRKFLPFPFSFLPFAHFYQLILQQIGAEL
ncbi:hypothetical protein ABZP36_031992 [Zizania latifolia]